MQKLTTAILLAIICVGLFPTRSLAQPDSQAQFSETVTVSEIACTLENGEASTCYQIEMVAIPEFEIGPFCPETLDDVGGFWDWDGENAGLYRLDGDFFLMLEAQGYNFVDENGNIYATSPNAAPLNSDANYCLAVPEDATVTMTAIIPANPVMADRVTELGTVSQVGIGVDGVPIFADAPSVLATGNLPALDECGGHVDPGGWYHWHATASDIDSSFDHEGLEDVHCHLEQSASALFGYAFDGYPIYGSAEPDGYLPENLDACNGHVGSDGEYHYHATLSFPNLPQCLVGVVANGNFSTTAARGIGSANVGSPPGQAGNGRPQGEPDLAVAAGKLGVTERALRDALGTPPPDFEAAAATLGVTVQALQDALGMAPPR